MIFFLAQGDSAASDTAVTFEIPDIVTLRGETHVLGMITPEYYDHATVDLLERFAAAPASYGLGVASTFMNKERGKYAYVHADLNGHPVSAQPFSQLLPVLLPLHAFDVLEYGNAAAGFGVGRIDLRSKVNRFERPYSFIQFMFGSFESNTYAFDLTRAVTDDLGFYLSGSYHKTRGHRENTDGEMFTASANVYADYLLPTRFDILYSNGESGYPGSTSIPVQGREEDEFLDAHITTRLAGVTATLFYERLTVGYVDTLYDRIWGAQKDHAGIAAERHDTLAGLAIDYGAIGSLTLMEGEEYLPDRSSGFEIWLGAGRSFGPAVLRASGRINGASDEDVFLCPRIEMGMRTVGSMVVYGALSRDARAPSVMEKWAPFDSLNPFLSVGGYEDLRPEFCRSGEIGVRGKGFFLDLYRLEFTDFITVLNVSDVHRMYSNIEDLDATGIEAHVHVPLLLCDHDSTTMTELALGFSGNALFSGSHLPLASDRSMRASVSMKRETRRFGFGIALSAEHAGERFDVSGVACEDYLVFGAAGFVKYLGLACIMRLNNAFDEEYAYAGGFPMPARNFDVSIKWEFWD